MMTEKTFRDNAQLREELLGLLNNATLKLALEIVEDRAKSRHLPDVRAGVPYDSTMSHQLHKNWGIQHAIDRLKLLSEPNSTEAEKEAGGAGEEFLHTLPPVMQEALKKKRQQQTA